MAKLANVAAQGDDIALCADTTVSVGRRILGKPRDAAEACAFLQLLSGRRHRTVTCVAVRRGTLVRERCVETRLQMRRLSRAEIEVYLRTGEWEGKAGGYAIQGRAAVFIPWISGSYSAVVGLPLAETIGLLQAVGFGQGGRQ